MGNTTTITLPSSWNQVSLRQLSELEDVHKQDLNEIHKANRLIAVLAKVPLSDIEALPFATISKFLHGMDWMNSMPNRLLTSFELEGKRYSVCNDLYRLTTGQYADLKTYINQQGFYRWAQCAAVMCLPEGEQYKGADVEARAELFWDQLTVDIVFPMCTFFLALYEQSLKTILPSLQRKAMKGLETIQEILMEE